MSDKLGANKIRKICLRWLAENFEIFSSAELIGQGNGQSLANQLHLLDKDILIEIIQEKAQLEFQEKYM